jgi:3-phenylpropionate/cinnamic acid dioxygenase small subunit
MPQGSVMNGAGAVRTGEDSVAAFLLKQEAIEYLRHLARLLDEFQMGRFVEEFIDGGHYRLIPRDNYEAGHPVCLIDDSKKRLRYRQKIIEKHWHYEKFQERRILSPVSVDVEGDRKANVFTNFVIFQTDLHGKSHLHLCGTLEDELRRVDGRWRINTRKAVLDSYLPDFAIVLPP